MSKPVQSESPDALQQLREDALAGLTELVKRDRDYLRNLPANKPVRNGARIQSTARLLLEFTQAKPAQATTLSGPGGGPVQSEHTIRFVDPPQSE